MLRQRVVASRYCVNLGAQSYVAGWGVVDFSPRLPETLSALFILIFLHLPKR